MTLKREQILGVQVELMRALLRYDEVMSSPAPFAALGNSRRELVQTAMAKLVASRLVRRADFPNRKGAGIQRGFAPTPKGRQWFSVASELYRTQTQTFIR